MKRPVTPPVAITAPQHVRVVRLGHGANCSSIGSVLDLLFATAAIGSAVFVAAAAAIAEHAPDEAPASDTDEPSRDAP